MYPIKTITRKKKSKSCQERDRKRMSMFIERKNKQKLEDKNSANNKINVLECINVEESKTKKYEELIIKQYQRIDELELELFKKSKYLRYVMNHYEEECCSMSIEIKKEKRLKIELINKMCIVIKDLLEERMKLCKPSDQSSKFKNENDLKGAII